MRRASSNRGPGCAGVLDRRSRLRYPRAGWRSPTRCAPPSARSFGLRGVGRDLPREAQVGGLVFYPLAGAAIGGLAAAAAALASPLGRLPAAAVAIGMLAGASGGQTLRSLARAGSGAGGRPARAVLVGAVVALKVWAAWRIPDGARSVALVLAAMLGRWAVVVQCYGGTPVPRAEGPARARRTRAPARVRLGQRGRVRDDAGRAGRRRPDRPPHGHAHHGERPRRRLPARGRRAGPPCSTSPSSSSRRRCCWSWRCSRALAGRSGRRGQAGRRGTSTRRRSDSTTSSRWLRARVST